MLESTFTRKIRTRDGKVYYSGISDNCEVIEDCPYTALKKWLQLVEFTCANIQLDYRKGLL